MGTPTPAPFNVGDLVVWMGINMVVVEVKDNGNVEALSTTMRVQAPAATFTAAQS